MSTSNACIATFSNSFANVSFRTILVLVHLLKFVETELLILIQSHSPNIHNTLLQKLVYTVFKDPFKFQVIWQQNGNDYLYNLLESAFYNTFTFYRLSKYVVLWIQWRNFQCQSFLRTQTPRRTVAAQSSCSRSGSVGSQNHLMRFLTLAYFSFV